MLLIVALLLGLIPFSHGLRERVTDILMMITATRGLDCCSSGLDLGYLNEVNLSNRVILFGEFDIRLRPLAEHVSKLLLFLCSQSEGFGLQFILINYLKTLTVSNCLQ